MPRALKKTIMVEVSRYVSEQENVINVFHGVNLNKIYPKAWINVITIFCSENLALFTFTSIHSIRKSIKIECSKQQDER